VPPGRKIMLHFEKDNIVLFHKSLPLSSVFDVGYTTVVNYKVRKQNDIIQSWMPAGYSLAPIFTDLVADNINRYAGRMSHKFVWMPGTSGYVDPKFMSWREDARPLTLTEERVIGADIMAACAMMHEFINQPHDQTHMKMHGVTFKKLGRVTCYMQRLLGPSSEQIRRWRGHGRPRDMFLEGEDSDVVEPPHVAPEEAEGSSRRRRGKRSKAGASTSPPPRATSRKGKEPRAGPSAASSPPKGRSGGRKARATAEEHAAAPEPEGPSLQQQLHAAQQHAEELTNRAVSHPTQANMLAAIEAHNMVDELDEQIRGARESERKGKRKVGRSAGRSAAAAAPRRPEGQNGARAPPEVPCSRSGRISCSSCSNCRNNNWRSCRGRGSCTSCHRCRNSRCNSNSSSLSRAIHTGTAATITGTTHKASQEDQEWEGRSPHSCGAPHSEGR
jgi:hypothetical protein